MNDFPRWRGHFSCLCPACLGIYKCSKIDEHELLLRCLNKHTIGILDIPSGCNSIRPPRLASLANGQHSLPHLFVQPARAGSFIVWASGSGLHNHSVSINPPPDRVFAGSNPPNSRQYAVLRNHIVGKRKTPSIFIHTYSIIDKYPFFWIKYVILNCKCMTK